MDNQDGLLGVDIEAATVIAHKAGIQWVLGAGSRGMSLRSLGTALVRRLAMEGVLQHSEPSLRRKAENRFCSQNIPRPFSFS